jgi:hypothetical protein
MIVFSYLNDFTYFLAHLAEGLHNVKILPPYNDIHIPFTPIHSLKNEKNKDVYSTSLQRNKMLRCMVVIFLRCVDLRQGELNRDDCFQLFKWFHLFFSSPCRRSTQRKNITTIQRNILLRCRDSLKKTEKNIVKPAYVGTSINQ